MREKYFFDDWREFSLQKPDQALLNHLETIKNNTNYNETPKYQNVKEVYKVFALFLTHNYGPAIYQLCIFLKYLIQNDIPLYSLMIMSGNEVIRKVKKINSIKRKQISNKVTFELKDFKFDITYSRFSHLLITLDFLEEFIGLEEIMLIEESIKKVKSQNELQTISNDISKKVYSYLKNLLPSLYLQRYSSAIGNFIVKKTEDENHKIVAQDISDDFIFDFWVASKDFEKDLLIKTFTLAADLCLTYKKSIEINENFIVSLKSQNDQEQYLNLISDKMLDEFLESIITYDEHILSRSFQKIMRMNENKVNILKKNELGEIEIFSKYNDLTLKLPLTVLRISVFGNIQNKIVESQRRKNLDLNIYYESMSKVQKYNDQIQILESIVNNSTFICEILFHKLWLLKSPEILHFIKNYFNEDELILFEHFLVEQKAKLDCDPSLDEIDLLKELAKENIESSPDEYREEQLTNLYKEFNFFINSKKFNSSFENFFDFIFKIKKQSSSFRRSGFDFNANNKENRELIVEVYNALLEIKIFLLKFIRLLNKDINNLETKFKEDKVLFFQHFRLLYEKEGI